MTSSSEITPEYLIRCVRCDNSLWTVKVLSHVGGKPQSTEWHSTKPELYKGRPQSWDCPLCKKEFAYNKGKLGYEMRMVDLATGRRVSG